MGSEQDLAVALEQLRTEVRSGFARLEERMESLTRQVAASDSDMDKLDDRVSALEKKMYTVAGLVGLISMFLPEGVRAAIGG
jgi:predicted  nucleic acid-binding Zn-ribbon protein